MFEFCIESINWAPLDRERKFHKNVVGRRVEWHQKLNFLLQKLFFWGNCARQERLVWGTVQDAVPEMEYFSAGAAPVWPEDTRKKDLAGGMSCLERRSQVRIPDPIQGLFEVKSCLRKFWKLPPIFQVPKISDLKQLDKNAYDYFYHQVRCDVLNNAIPEIAYPNFKNDILGLCVTDMFVEMIENNRSVDYLNKNYKKYIPKEYEKYHSVFARKEIKASLKSIKNKEHDVL